MKYSSLIIFLLAQTIFAQQNFSNKLSFNKFNKIINYQETENEISIYAGKEDYLYISNFDKRSCYCTDVYKITLFKGSSDSTAKVETVLSIKRIPEFNTLGFVKTYFTDNFIVMIGSIASESKSLLLIYSIENNQYKLLPLRNVALTKYDKIVLMENLNTEDKENSLAFMFYHITDNGYFVNPTASSGALVINSDLELTKRTSLPAYGEFLSDKNYAFLNNQILFYERRRYEQSSDANTFDMNYIDFELSDPTPTPVTVSFINNKRIPHIPEFYVRHEQNIYGLYMDTCMIHYVQFEENFKHAYTQSFIDVPRNFFTNYNPNSKSTNVYLSGSLGDMVPDKWIDMRNGLVCYLNRRKNGIGILVIDLKNMQIVQQKIIHEKVYEFAESMSNGNLLVYLKALNAQKGTFDKVVSVTPTGEILVKDEQEPLAYNYDILTQKVYLKENDPIENLCFQKNNSTDAILYSINSSSISITLLNK